MWALLSILWVGGTLWFCWPIEWRYMVGLHGLSDAYVSGVAVPAEAFARYALAPPTALLVLGCMLEWVVRGFR